MNSLRCAGLWWILCSRFWRKWWQTCLLWFFSTSDVKVTTLTIQASTTWIRPLHTFLLQWNLHRFSSHVRKKSDRTNFPACTSHPKFPVHSSRMYIISMFCRHVEVAYFLVHSTHWQIIFHLQRKLMRLINLKLCLICDIFTFDRSISRHAFDLNR